VHLTPNRSVHKQSSKPICVSKTITDVAYYNLKPHEPILIIFGRGVAERVCYTIEGWFDMPPFLNNVSALPGDWGNMNPGNYLFSYDADPVTRRFCNNFARKLS